MYLCRPHSTKEWTNIAAKKNCCAGEVEDGSRNKHRACASTEALTYRASTSRLNHCLSYL